MKPLHYRDQFIALQKAAPDKDAVSHLAKQIANSFMDHYYQDGHYDDGYIELMCDMAVFFADKELKRAVSSAFFSVIIEELCDDYEDFQFAAYSRVMSQVISYYRRVPAGGRIDRYLNQFELFSAADIFKRAGRIHTQHDHFHADKKAINRIYLLSRITVGADVAIVSVMIQRLSILFPNAQIILLGSLKLNELFVANPRLRIREAAYIRGGGLLERLESWCEVVDMLHDETAAVGENAVLLVDPDSRITQLGIMPLVEDDKYLHFNSHDDSPSAKNASMAQLANAWIDRVFGRSDFCYPRVWLDPEVLNHAQKVTHGLRQSGCQRITTINFGVGGNPRKRLGLDFEKKLICELLKQPGSVVILDRGFGAEELASSQAIIEEVKSKGHAVCRTDFKHGSVESFSHGLLAVDCTIGEISALIGCSDDFIGYDSACQHIAAALAIPGITVFVGSNNPRFIRRWSACGNTSCRIVHVDTLGHSENVNLDEIINRIMEERPLITRKTGPAIKIVSYPKPQPGESMAKETLKDQTL